MEDITTPPSSIKKTAVMDIEKEALSLVAKFLIVATILIIFLTLVFTGLLLAKKNSLKKLQDKTAELDIQLESLSDLDEKVSAFSSAVSNIQSALDQKQKWSLVFKELNNVTPKDVVYTNFSADEAGKIKIQGSAPSLTSLARLILALKQDKEKPQKANPKFQNVILTSTSISTEKITFSLSLTLTSKALK